MVFRVCFFLLVAALGSSCVTTTANKGGAYDCPAHRPTNPKNVAVKVSLHNRMVYVMEGSRPLLVTPTCIGKPGSATPTGHFKAFNKIAKKRSGTYGYHVAGGSIRPGTSRNKPSSARYVGYPMAWWVEFASGGYGFHSGCVWPMPRTHGCLRLHENVAPKFYALVPEGTPIHIAQTQPEDSTLGRNVPRPTDYANPDPPLPMMISDAIFKQPKGPLFVN